jgi:hypothetical protein
MKHSLHPDASTAPGTDGDPRAPDYLRKDLLNRLAKGPIRFQLSVQLFEDEESTPVKDASVVWKLRPLPIGELEIAALPTQEEERLIDRRAFNPGNGFEPLGITHPRREVYAASARNRKAASTEDIRRHFAPPIRSREGN